MAEGVVDGLEVVEVEERHGDDEPFVGRFEVGGGGWRVGGEAGASADVGEAVGELQFEGGAVGEAGEGVGEGLAAECLFGAGLAGGCFESADEEGEHDEAGEDADDERGAGDGERGACAAVFDPGLFLAAADELGEDRGDVRLVVAGRFRGPVGAAVEVLEADHVEAIGVVAHLPCGAFVDAEGGEAADGFAELAVGGDAAAGPCENASVVFEHAFRGDGADLLGGGFHAAEFDLRLPALVGHAARAVGHADGGDGDQDDDSEGQESAHVAGSSGCRGEGLHGYRIGRCAVVLEALGRAACGTRRTAEARRVRSASGGCGGEREGRAVRAEPCA